MFETDLVQTTRLQYQGLSKHKRDVVILAKIECGIHSSHETERPKQKKQSVRQSTWTAYQLHGRRICRDLFQHLHCISEKQLDTLLRHYRYVGVEPRRQANKKKLPGNALSFQDNKRIVEFIIHYANLHAMTLPGRTPNHWVSTAQLLPTNCSKGTVYAAYKEASIAANVRVAAKRTFRWVWQILLPFISTMKPAADLCFYCQKGATRISRSANLPDEDKSAAVKEMEAHLLKVTKERSYLRHILETTKRDLPADYSLGQHGQCSYDDTVHYSFDFAQQLQFPSNPLQPGPIYFKVPRKCGLFGVHWEALNKQVNFLIDEGVCVRKGADCVISLLHFFF